METTNLVGRRGIEQTILERIRLWLVAAGYLPDINSFLPKTPITEVAYQAAITAQIAGGKQIIEPFGVSSGDKRDEKRMHKILINFRNSTNGTIHLNGDRLEPSGVPNEYQRVHYSTSSKNLIYDIRTVTDSVEYDRILTQAIMESLTSSGVGTPYHPILADGSGYDPDHYFWLKFITSTDVKTPPFFERIYTYGINNIFIDDWGYAPYQTQIPIITKIEGYGTEIGEEILIFEAE